MKKYIEQEAVIRLIKTEGFNEKYDLGDPKDNAWFCEEVNRIPAADVVEVKHGRWIWLSSTYDRTPCEKRYWCDKCHHEVITHGSEPWEKYCPNCGARMDGGAK